MVRENGNKKQQKRSKIGVFFLATLVIWGLSVGFELVTNKRRELAPVIYGCLIFQIANWVLRFWVSREPLFVNTSVSLLHSSFASASVVFILFNQWTMKHSLQMFDHEELVRNTWPWAYTALCISCGYFAYDQWDMLNYGLYSGWFPSILAHHLILLLCFTLALYRNITINYLILTLICELHSVFLHVRKVRRMAGIRSAESTIVKVEWILNWLTFVFARVLPHAMILIKLVKDAPKFGNGVELPLALFGMIGMNLLNIGLGIDIWGAYKREKNPPRDQHSD
ncbi:TLC domain-containing protein 2 [Bienertia sinuspersici]